MPPPTSPPSADAIRTLVVTGASGLIGRALLAVCAARGWRVQVAGRRPPSPGPPGLDFAEWHLGQPLPWDLTRVDAVVHLASATLTAGNDFAAAAAADVDGTAVIHDQMRQARARRGDGGPRFLFCSSQTADAGARSAYGRSKRRIEQRLTDDGDVVLRPGLVLGPATQGAYATLRYLVRRLPVVPVPAGRPPAIQPIEVTVLAEAIARLVERPIEPARRWSLAAGQPMTLRTLVDFIAERERLPRPWTLPLPGRLLAAALGAAARLLPPLRPLDERVQGLVALRPLPEAATDAGTLGLPGPLAGRRRWLRARLRSNRALLSYVSGRRAVPLADQLAMARWSLRVEPESETGRPPFRLPPPLVRLPPLLRCLEPTPGAPPARLSRHLAAASAIAAVGEAARAAAAPPAEPGPVASLLGLGLTGTVELLLLPLRRWLGRRLAPR